MKDIINIEILDKSGHDDLKFCIKELTSDLTFDTYYFALSIEPFENFKDLKVCVASFLHKWLTETKSMISGQERYFPIDISDQYTGCLKVSKQTDNLEITYGISNREGYTVDINTPQEYFIGITDFQSDIPNKLIVKQCDFESSIQSQIDKLLDI
jgi:hypothetical protein